MRKREKNGKRGATLITALTAMLVTMLCAGATLSPVWASVPRFGVDQHNSRRITDSLEETGFPFQKKWQTDLGGEVESQPIIHDGRIYVLRSDPDMGTTFRITLKNS